MQTGTRVEHVHRGPGWRGSVVRMVGPSRVAVRWDAGSVTEDVSRYALRLIAGTIPGTVADTPTRQRMRRDRGASNNGLGLLLAVGAVTIALLAASAYAKRHHGTVGPSPSPTVTASPAARAASVTDDETAPEYNCLTMGDELCSPLWAPVPRDLYGPLSESTADRDWRDCLIRYADTTVIVCTDGKVYTS